MFDFDMIETKIKCNVSLLSPKQSLISDRKKYEFPVPKHGLFQLPAPHWTDEDFSLPSDPMFINGYWARQTTRYKVLPNMYDQINTLIPECEWIMFHYEIKPYEVEIPFNSFSKKLTNGVLATNCTKAHLRTVIRT